MKLNYVGRCIAFGDFRLYPEAGKLLRRGQPVCPARPLEVQLLTFLIENIGRTITREETCKHLWPELCLSPNRLNVLISNLRAALGDNRRDQRMFIATIEGGYRFIHPVSEVTRPGVLSRR